MPQDLLEVALRSPELAEDYMANPELTNSFIAIIDRFIFICGKDDVKDLKLEGPNSATDGFDVSWKMGVKNG